MPSKTHDFITLAFKRLKRCIDADDHNRKGAVEDLKFLNGEQWDATELQRRQTSGRPALKVNLLPKFVDQVVGDERHNRPRIKVRPLSSDASSRIAQIREGYIATTEYVSNAEAIYDQAFEQMVSGRYGAWRVLTRWCEDDPWNQEIYLERITNPLTVYMDPDCKDIVYADAKYGFIVERMAREEFKEKYKDAKEPGGIHGERVHASYGMDFENWFDKDRVTIVEYFLKRQVEITICQMEDGSVLDKSEADKLIKQWDEQNQVRMDAAQSAMGMLTTADPNMIEQMAQQKEMAQQQPQQPSASPNMPSATPAGSPAASPTPNMGPGGTPASAAPPMGNSAAPAVPGNMGTGQSGPPTAGPPPPAPRPRILRSRKADRTEIRHYLITTEEILDVGSDSGDKQTTAELLEGRKVPGQYIPIVLLKGRERNVEGKTFIRGLITDAKDPQRLFNYWTTAAAEIVALAPKAPWLGTQKQFQGYEQDYAMANIENYPLLKYNVDEKASGPPQRNHPGNPPIAIFTQIEQARENIKSSVGMFNADMGDNSPERTGAAVEMKQRPGDIGTFAFIDNLNRGVLHTGRIINGMIPDVIDSERDIRLRSIDDTETFVPVNTTAGEALSRIQQNPERYSGADIHHVKYIVRARGEKAAFNDVSVGKYDVQTVIGPSYSTQRSEASTAMMGLIQAMPKQMAVAADLLVENMDFKGKEQLAERLRKTLPAGMVKPKPGEPPPQPMPPQPQMILLMEKIKSEREKQQVQKLKAQESMIKILRELKDSEVEVRKEVLNVLAELHATDHPADGGIDDSVGSIGAQNSVNLLAS